MKAHVATLFSFISISLHLKGGWFFSVSMHVDG
jgi:hypothetical protein